LPSAVIFGIRQVIFALRVYKGEYNITFCEAKNKTTHFMRNITAQQYNFLRSYQKGVIL
jgi:penicillin-binding protein-related factor A (putative recombinase)